MREESKGQIRQDNEALILAAAETVFAGAGFSGATMAQIAAEAGLPKANLHYYFGSKESLYRTVLGHILQDWLAPADAQAPPQPTKVEVPVAFAVRVTATPLW